MFKPLIAGALSAVLWASGALASFDVVILNGRVMDPESGLDAIRNVGIKDGKILSLSQDLLEGKYSIDATGLVVAPGFIDLHHHDQNTSGYQISVQDGVTTALELEDGVFPVKKWYRQRENKAPINFGATASHMLIRATVFGAVELEELSGDTQKDLDHLQRLTDATWVNTDSTVAQRKKMATLFQLGLQEGGLGFGHHLANTPGASVAEMLELYQQAEREEVVNFIHIRSFGQVAPTVAGREVVEAAKTTGASIHVVHLNSSGVWEIRELLDILDDARQKGLDITTEVYPYSGASSSLDDPRVSKESLVAIGADYSDLELVATGERLTEESLAYHKAHAQQRDLVAHIMPQADIDAAVVHPMVSIGSDSIGSAHPRGAGTFSRIFGHYVRDRKALTLMEALRKVSLMPAQRLENSVPQMKMRGRIQEGMVADITVFDPDVIVDQATYANPVRPSVGIAYVLINGVPVVSDYHLLENVYPGKAIRRFQ